MNIQITSIVISEEGNFYLIQILQNGGYCTILQRQKFKTHIKEEKKTEE